MIVSPRRWIIAAGIVLHAYGKQLAAKVKSGISAAVRLGGAIFAALKEHAHDLLDPKVGIPVAIVTLAAGAVALALTLRIVSPKTVIVVIPFGVPVEEHRNIPYSGESLTNLLVDEFQSVIRTSDDFRGTTDYSSSKQYNPLPDTPKIPVQTSFEFTVHGVSVNEISKIWRYLRYNQESISGEVVRSSPGRVRLRARLTSSSEARYWEIPEEIDDNAVPSQLSDLAARVFSDLHPATLGRYYLRNRKTQKAAEVFGDWAARDPENADAFYYLGYALTKMEQFDLARAAEERSNELQHHRGHRALGQLAIIDLDEADRMNSQGSSALYEEALKYDRLAIAASCPAWRCWIPGQHRYPNYALNLGVLFERLGLFEDALQAERDALSLDQQDAGARANMGSTLLQMAEKKSYRRKREEYVKQAVEQIQCALRLKPYFPRHLSILINALLDLQRKKDIEQKIEPALEQSVDREASQPLAVPPCSREGQREGNILSEPRKKAEEIARWAVLMRPNAEEPLFELGYILLDESLSLRPRNLGESRELYTSATEILGKALSSQPTSAEILTSQAHQLRRLDVSWADQFSNQAIVLLNARLQDEPKNTALHRDLGDAYFEGRRFAEAAISYRDALAQFPGYGRLAGFHVRLADALYLSGPRNLDSALAHYKVAETLGSSELNSCLSQFHLAHALRYSSSPDPTKAIEAYAKGKSLAENGKDDRCKSAQFYTEFADALREQGDSKRALEIGKIAQDLDPSLARPVRLDLKRSRSGMSQK